ncbi:pyrroloquinoline quinone precursor peptide PqqA [Saccharopolyspora sp. K220]|uniref:pyrroloquinoline quinone precursor peptide PqqA n=1 Tax=Saccharopolyspora soli TaxID=2926618 RepID=UPI001F579CCB|nr:pyrroloquinoline quinone precursor peptide PqqA [Saccharopolyspora soli]MCI2419746.1 pyrroloquinoline quinone precursor peptide PqqA [Saccharopolyspora soli]
MGRLDRGIPPRHARRWPRKRTDRLRTPGLAAPRGEPAGVRQRGGQPTGWETPAFDEIGVAPEVTRYVAGWRTSDRGAPDIRPVPLPLPGHHGARERCRPRGHTLCGCRSPMAIPQNPEVGAGSETARLRKFPRTGRKPAATAP